MSTWIDDLTVVFLLPIRTNYKHLLFPCLISSVYSSSYGFPWPSHNINFWIVYHLWFIYSILQVKLTWWTGCVTSLELHVGLANICGVPLGAWNCGQWQGSEYKLNICLFSGVSQTVEDKVTDTSFQHLVARAVLEARILWSSATIQMTFINPSNILWVSRDRHLW